MISTPSLKRYRNSEFIAFFSDVLQFVNTANITALTTPLVSLQNAYDDLGNSFKVSKGSLITESIQALDARRDVAVKGIRMSAKAFMYHFDDDIKAAATAVFQNIIKYGSRLTELNYQGETASLKSLIKDFENDTTLTAALTTLNLSAWVAELKTANESFEQKYLERITDNADKKVTAVGEHRPAAITAYQNLVKHIEANAVLNPSDELTVLINNLEELVGKYNQI